MNANQQKNVKSKFLFFMSRPVNLNCANVEILLVFTVSNLATPEIFIWTFLILISDKELFTRKRPAYWLTGEMETN